MAAERHIRLAEELDEILDQLWGLDEGLHNRLQAWIEDRAGTMRSGVSGHDPHPSHPEPEYGVPRPNIPRGHAFGVGLLDDGSYRFWLPRRLVLAWNTVWRHRGGQRGSTLRTLYWQVLRGHETEICDRCGGPVRVVFHVPDDIWTLATGYERFPDGESAQGVLCPPCVDALVEPKIDGYLTWTCKVAR